MLEDDCPECRAYVAIGMALNVYRENNGDADKLLEELMDEKLTIAEVMDKIRSEVSEDDKVIVDDLKEEMEKSEPPQKKQNCISLKVKLDAERNIDELIADRKEFLKDVASDAETARQAEELIKNLELTKKTISHAPVCEDRGS